MLLADLDAGGVSCEVIVVDDGGGDFGPADFDDDRVRLQRQPRNLGKGAAVRTGMQLAAGRACIFTDVDVPFGTQPVLEIARRLLHGSAHMVIGDRTLPGSEYRMRIGWPRRAASLVFTAVVGSLVTDGLYDTQCGLKGLRADAAAALFPLLRIDRFAFDVELVSVALAHGLRIERIPVRLIRNESSSVRLPRDAVRGAVDLVRLRVFRARGCYRNLAAPLDHP
jgi:dolichyl-phosphate beta-glucosyltransferase